MNLLTIGNSFSQDATRYLHGIAAAGGVNLSVVNIEIGGCPLSKHYRNMMGDFKAYSLECDGRSTGFSVSIKEALLNRDWDVISLQQVSHLSAKYDTYQPFIGELAKYIRSFQPKAKLAVHETWAYEEVSERLKAVAGFDSRKDMYCALHGAYMKAASDIGAEIFIPSGTLFEKISDAGIENVHRDTFHASLGAGRYALGLIWYHILTGNPVKDNGYAAFDEPVSEKEIEIIKSCVDSI